ncbi:hypothetical protein OESDEN_03315 [Oesophagostomum dentatum]|uniref:G-protein coupled receptors family 1 profile domain-containing protein n=1 Tax=Oesophagostomum dentatum TaxID=61180 RepID=A0A0B1TLN4_OESDE|nr:hypothetical protein OESDEN_03315 [Oesophagostomum dentatum]
MQNSFGRLLTSQATGETVFCFIFAFYFSPTVFLNIDPMKMISRHFGLILLICYDICIFSHLFIALNRLCAICMPLRYTKLFSNSNTKLMMLASWIIPLLLCSLLYVYYDCGLIYEDSIYAFVWVPSNDCKFISWDICFRKDVCIVSIIAIADITTIIKVHITNKQIHKSGQRDTDRRRKKEINFLKQAVLQGIVFAFELYTYFILAWHFQNKWIIFALTSVTWTCTHSSDALIIIALNSEFRKLITVVKRPFRKCGQLEQPNSHENVSKARGYQINPIKSGAMLTTSETDYAIRGLA